MDLPTRRVAGGGAASWSAPHAKSFLRLRLLPNQGPSAPHWRPCCKTTFSAEQSCCAGKVGTGPSWCGCAPEDSCCPSIFLWGHYALYWRQHTKDCSAQRQCPHLVAMLSLPNQLPCTGPLSWGRKHKAHNWKNKKVKKKIWLENKHREYAPFVFIPWWCSRRHFGTKEI